MNRILLARLKGGMLISFFLLVLIGKGQDKDQAVFYKNSYEDYLEEINDSLSSSNSFKDSVICLRNMVHAFYRCGRKSSDWEALGYKDTWNWTAEDWFSRFNGDSISSKCGGAASFLSALYREYGFTSFTISLGMDDSSDTRGHIQVAVSPNKKCCPGLDELYLMDPMFNFHYEGLGSLASIEEMLRLIDLKREDSLFLITDSRHALHLQRLPIINPFYPEIEKSKENKVYRSKNPKNRYLVSAPRTIKRYLKGNLKNFYQDMIAQYKPGISLDNSANFKYSVLAIRAFYSSCCDLKLEEEYKSLRENIDK